MSVEVIARLRHTQEPVNGFQSLVGWCIFIMDPKWRGVRNENIERATVLHLVQHQPGSHAKSSPVGFRLGMLVRPVRAVANRPAEAADQKFLESDHFQIQVGTAFHARQGIFGVVGGVMIARHIKQRNVQHRQQIFQVGVGQVSTAQDHLDLTKVTTGTKVVQAIDHLIADGKNFHSKRIVPQNDVPRKGFYKAEIGGSVAASETELTYEIEMLLTDGWLSKEAGQTIIDEARRRTTGNKDFS